MINNLDAIKDIALITSSIGTLSITYFTIGKWKTEFKAKAYFDCSYKLLKTVYNLRDTFESMRVNMILPNEQLPRTDSKDYNRDNMLYVLKNRAVPFQQALNDFYSIRPEVEVLFKKDTRQICDDINGIVSNYSMYRNSYLQLIDNTNNFEYLAEISSHIFLQKDDDLKLNLNIAIEKIENAVSKHLSLTT